MEQKRSLAKTPGFFLWYILKKSLALLPTGLTSLGCYPGRSFCIRRCRAISSRMHGSESFTSTSTSLSRPHSATWRWTSLSGSLTKTSRSLSRPMLATTSVKAGEQLFFKSIHYLPFYHQNDGMGSGIFSSLAFINSSAYLCISESLSIPRT